MTDTLYARLGGRGALAAVTARFYDAVLADPLLEPFFAEIDVAALTGMQAAFLSLAFGGPDTYRGRDLREAHAGMELSDEHFDRVIQVLGQVLEEAGVSDEDITAAAAIAETTRTAVLGR